MRVDVVESLAASDAVVAVNDAGVNRALQSFTAAISSEESLFAAEMIHAVVMGGSDGQEVCVGDWELQFRSASLASNRRLHFLLIEKLLALLKEAGSADSLAASLCLRSSSAADAKLGELALKLRLEACGNSVEQAGLRWALGLAHVQQALLFASRYLRQQITQSGD
jgi:hypothetical protein